MYRFIKDKLYFSIAHYFRFFAMIKLWRWQPRIIVITGSSGKTTLLHLVESQLKDIACYSHHANSTYGIPFDILGLKRKKLTPGEWLYLFLAAPVKAFCKAPQEKIYVVEADCDRPGEGKFLASLLKPEVTLWLNSGKAHGANYGKLIVTKKFSNVEQAIAHEYGYLIEHAKKLAIVNGDIKPLAEQLPRFKGQVKLIGSGRLNDYRIIAGGTEFVIDNTKYRFAYLLPRATFYSIAMAQELLLYLKIKFNESFDGFRMPPGRSSILPGIKNTVLIDSSYNATPDGMAVSLDMFNQYPAEDKWLVLGDMIELGSEEQAEHEKLAELIVSVKTPKIILVGPRIIKYTCPKLKTLLGGKAGEIAKFEFPKDALDYINNNLHGGETILFKGARFLEGIIEHLLFDKNDAGKLCRRERIWQIRRKQWGL